MKREDNNTNQEEEKERKMHVNAYHILQGIKILYMTQ